MNSPSARKKIATLALTATLMIAGLGLVLWYASSRTDEREPFRYVHTIAGIGREFGEPYGIAVRGDEIFVSDGEQGKIWRIVADTAPVVFASGLDTPSAIAFDPAGNLIVADAGSHTVKSIDAAGNVRNLAGVDGRSGFADGDAGSSLFSAPIGVAAAPDGRIIVADTYNDRIRVIKDGRVSTLAGGIKGFADGSGAGAKLDTPCGVTLWQDKILVADMGNRRLRMIEPDGRVWTLAGGDEGEAADALLSTAVFARPTAVAVDDNGSIFVADGNAIRKIAASAIPFVSTLSARWRGLDDGAAARARFNRPSGLALDVSGRLLVADSDNRLVRRFDYDSIGHEITPEEIAAMCDTPDQFRNAAPARWPYDPPDTKRDVAGTLGEIRGEIEDENSEVWFHNGLDIAGGYGETARFIRDEKVLDPIAAGNFGTLRELLRMPTLGYIHIRLGRRADASLFGDSRFMFERDGAGKLSGVRVPRGSKFKAGEPIGTLNPMNHIHLIAGRSGNEMNALDALTLPGISDKRPPVIEKVTILDENWRELETPADKSRINTTGRIRIVVRAYDQMDGNSERRRLGVYRLGYQILTSDKIPLAEPEWTIVFDRMPSNEAVKIAYAGGSRSGATGETIFNYIVTNFVNGNGFGESFINTSTLRKDNVLLRVFAADYFGNVSIKDLNLSLELSSLPN